MQYYPQEAIIQIKVFIRGWEPVIILMEWRNCQDLKYLDLGLVESKTVCSLLIHHIRTAKGTYPQAMTKQT